MENEKRVTPPEGEQTAPEILEAEVLTNDEFITKSIQRYNLPDAKISELKAEFSGLVVIDADSYESVKKARAVVRKYRTGLEAKRKELKAVAIKYGKAVDGEAERLTTLLLEVETPLDTEIKKWETQKEAERAEKERLLQEKINARISTLAKLGVSFDGSDYTNGESLTLSPVQIKEMPDDQFQFFVGLSEQWNAEQKEKQRIAEEQRLAEQKRLEDEKAELKRQQDEIAEQQRRLQEERQQMENDRLKLEQEKAEAERQRKQKLFNERTNQLAELGFTLSTSAALATRNFTRVGVVNVPLSTIAEISDAEFAEVLADAAEKVKVKETENEKLEAEYQKELQEAADKRAAENLRLQQQKEKEDAEAAEAEKQRLAELAPDKEKLQLFAKELRNFIDKNGEVQLKTATSKKVFGETIVLLEKTYTFVLDKANGLR